MSESENVARDTIQISGLISEILIKVGSMANRPLYLYYFEGEIYLLGYKENKWAFEFNAWLRDKLV